MGVHGGVGGLGVALADGGDDQVVFVEGVFGDSGVAEEAEELKNESDFIGPQPFSGRDSKFEGLHFPNDIVAAPISGLVELAMKIDATGNLKDLRLVSEYPPLAGFWRAAAEDFRVAKFIPAFRDGKPVECSITLPVYYEP